jgi:hypothetical protein
MQKWMPPESSRSLWNRPIVMCCDVVDQSTMVAVENIADIGNRCPLSIDVVSDLTRVPDLKRAADPTLNPEHDRDS